MSPASGPVGERLMHALCQPWLLATHERLPEEPHEKHPDTSMNRLLLRCLEGRCALRDWRDRRRGIGHAMVNTVFRCAQFNV